MTPELAQEQAEAERENAEAWSKMPTAEKVKYYAMMPYWYCILPYLP